MKAVLLREKLMSVRIMRSCVCGERSGALTAWRRRQTVLCVASRTVEAKVEGRG